MSDVEYWFRPGMIGQVLHYLYILPPWVKYVESVRGGKPAPEYIPQDVGGGLIIVPALLGRTPGDETAKPASCGGGEESKKTARARKRGTSRNGASASRTKGV